MGMPEWLARNPAAAEAGFGRALLRGIAVRMRTPEDDPILALLEGERPQALDAALTAWRVGADRWLRRRVRRRLVDVVRRRGALLVVDNRAEVRFPLDAADIALRRLALDVDPGWTSWLGLAVRYHYRAEPLS
jgi:hypothetical protein